MNESELEKLKIKNEELKRGLRKLELDEESSDDRFKCLCRTLNERTEYLIDAEIELDKTKVEFENLNCLMDALHFKLDDANKENEELKALSVRLLEDYDELKQYVKNIKYIKTSKLPCPICGHKTWIEYGVNSLGVLVPIGVISTTPTIDREEPLQFVEVLSVCVHCETGIWG